MNHWVQLVYDISWISWYDVVMMVLTIIWLCVASYIWFKQLSISNEQTRLSKEQKELTEWIFKVTEIKKHLDDMSDVMNWNGTIEEKEEAKEIFNDLKEHYSEILQKRYF